MSIQGKLWNSITVSDFLDESGIYSQCLNERESEQERICEEMSEKFIETLNDGQARAFRDVLALADMLSWERHSRGIAEGLILARELRVFLENPLNALLQGNSLLKSPIKANELSINRVY